ncbi:Uncharacterised protein [Orientia tsutsugamushi]|nr:Uncharacterised protein [Orientia tsutsugamushi]
MVLSNQKVGVKNKLNLEEQLQLLMVLEYFREYR